MVKAIRNFILLLKCDYGGSIIHYYFTVKYLRKSVSAKGCLNQGPVETRNVLFFSSELCSDTKFVFEEIYGIFSNCLLLRGLF